jgi:hypothetical protein
MLGKDTGGFTFFTNDAGVLHSVIERAWSAP